MNWKCKRTWKQAKINTLWCLLGCSIGDFGTIFYFQNIDHSWSNFEVLGLAIINGLLTSIILETIILLKQMDFYSSLKTALGMSFISMLGMEIAMNVTDLILLVVQCLLGGLFQLCLWPVFIHLYLTIIGD